MLRRLVLATATVVLALAALLGPTSTPAGAWGERDAVRSCGTNWIQSWATSTEWRAQTSTRTGSCAGPLVSAIRFSDGSLRRVIVGSSTAASSTLARSGNPGAVGGGHRGCPTCGLSTT